MLVKCGVGTASGKGKDVYLAFTPLSSLNPQIRLESLEIFIDEEIKT